MSLESIFTILSFVVGFLTGLVIRAVITRQRRTKVRDGIDDREQAYDEEKKKAKSQKDKKLRSL